MRPIFLLLFISLFTACIETHNKKIESNKSKQDSIFRSCSLSLSLFGAPWDDNFFARFDVNDKSGDSLVIGKCSRINQKDSCIFKRIYLFQNEQDSLFNLFKNIKTNFKLLGEQSDIKDGVKVRVSIAAGTTALSYTYFGLTNPDINRLFNFINVRLPKEFQFY